MAPIPPDLYGQVIDWVAQQQQLAMAGSPATMTAAQRKALIELHRLVKPAEVEPDLAGGADWVSDLNRYRQSNPSTRDIMYTDEPVGEPPAPTRWIVYCHIDECPKAFPGPEGGLNPATGLPYPFSRKQLAKAYAAKCAYEWLLAKGYTRTTPHGQQPGDGHTEKAPGQQQLLLPAPSGGASVHPPGAGEGQPPCKRVTDLCGELGLPPPRYHIDEIDGAYDGYALFEGIAQYRFASGGLGRVRQALTRNVAKDMIAEGVAKELLKMKQNRVRQNVAILGPAQS